MKTINFILLLASAMLCVLSIKWFVLCKNEWLDVAYAYSIVLNAITTISNARDILKR